MQTLPHSFQDGSTQRDVAFWERNSYFPILHVDTVTLQVGQLLHIHLESIQQAPTIHWGPWLQRNVSQFLLIR